MEEVGASRSTSRSTSRVQGEEEEEKKEEEKEGRKEKEKSKNPKKRFGNNRYNFSCVWRSGSSLGTVRINVKTV